VSVRDTFTRLVARLRRGRVRFLLIGVAGANYYAPSGAAMFMTQDRDLLLPLDARNLLRAWRACEACGLALWCGADPLDVPRDLAVAEHVLARRALVQATDGLGLDVDLTLVMAGLDFETAWKRRRTFKVHGVSIPVARLADIVESKARAGRDKDRLFLATHAKALEELIRRER
jgi:hypothetical protein